MVNDGAEDGMFGGRQCSFMEGTQHVASDFVLTSPLIDVTEVNERIGITQAERGVDGWVVGLEAFLMNESEKLRVRQGTWAWEDGEDAVVRAVGIVEGSLKAGWHLFLVQ